MRSELSWNWKRIYIFRRKWTKKIQSGVSRRTTGRERKQIWTYVMKSRLIISVHVYCSCSNWSILALDHMTPISIAFPIAKQSPNHNVCVIFGQCQSVSCSSEEKKYLDWVYPGEERSIFRMPPDTHATLQFFNISSGGAASNNNSNTV